MRDNSRVECYLNSNHHLSIMSVDSLLYICILKSLYRKHMHITKREKEKKI